MDKKGQMAMIGLLMMVFVAILVGVIIFQQIAQTIGTTNTEYSYINQTKTLAATGSSIYLTDVRALSSVVITNATGGDVVPSSNYTITNNVVSDGSLTVQVTTNAGGWNGSSVNISGTAQPLTYIDNSGGRSMVSIILIFFALAIAVVAMYPIYQDPNFRAMLGMK
jgi:hypothetical protein